MKIFNPIKPPTLENQIKDLELECLRAKAASDKAAYYNAVSRLIELQSKLK